MAGPWGASDSDTDTAGAGSGRLLLASSELAGAATRLFYLSEEAKEGRDAFLEKRPNRMRQLPRSKL